MQIRSTAVDANSNGMESAHVKKAILGHDSDNSHEFKNFVIDVEETLLRSVIQTQPDRSRLPISLDTL